MTGQIPPQVLCAGCRKELLIYTAIDLTARILYRLFVLYEAYCHCVEKSCEDFSLEVFAGRVFIRECFVRGSFVR